MSIDGMDKQNVRDIYISHKLLGMAKIIIIIILWWDVRWITKEKWPGEV